MHALLKQHIWHDKMWSKGVKDVVAINDRRYIYIIESVDSISRDGPDMPYYIPSSNLLFCGYEVIVM